MSNEKVTDTPTWPEAIRAAIGSMLGDVHVGLPGKVEAWDPATQLADIKPLVQSVFYTRDRDRVVEALPCIPNVPLLIDRTDTAFLSLPIKVGDHVKLSFIERSIDQFMAKKGEDTDPLDVRRFDLSDAVARVPSDKRASPGTISISASLSARKVKYPEPLASRITAGSIS